MQNWHFTTGQWFIIVAASISMISYAHGNFVTIREKQDIAERLKRIEYKIDRISESLREAD